MKEQLLKIWYNFQHYTWETLLMVFAAVISPNITTMSVVGGLIMIDGMTGIIASMKRGEPFTSKRLRDTLTKIVFYNLAILTGFLVEKYLLDGSVAATKLIAGIAGATELVSCLENIQSITNTTIFSGVIKKLTSSKDD